MYPDTDLPPLPVPFERTDRVKDSINANPFEAYERFRSLGLSNETVRQLMRNGRWLVFDRVANELGVDARFAARVLTERLRWLGRAGFDVSQLLDDEVFELFRAYKTGNLSKEAVGYVMRDILAEGDALAAAVECHSSVKQDEKAVSKLVSERVNARRDLIDALSADKAFDALMGDIMRACSKKLEPREVAKALRAALNKAYEQA
jgi:Glu-tRNA(Gln) amidotransferase subunit E-like FAD-binding protein